MIDPTQAAGQPAPAPQQGTVCIAPQGDGTFMVYLKGDDNATMQGGHAAPSGEGEQQPAQDVDSALELARQMLSGGAQDPAAADKQVNDLFQAGFDGANPRATQG